MHPKFRKAIAQDWAKIIAIIVISFTATYYLIRNPRPISALAGQVTGTIGSVGFLVDDIRHEKTPKAFNPPAGSVPGSVPNVADSSSAEPFDPAELFAVKVMDGETIRLSNGEFVRLIGVKAGETAAAFIKEEIEGKNIVLSYDAQTKDPNGRTLVYVRRRSDNFFLNAEMIKQGFGLTDVSTPFEKVQEFSAYEQQARAEKRGIWDQAQS